MTEKELAGTAPAALADRLPTLGWSELWGTYQLLGEWWHRLLAEPDTPSVNGWGLNEIRTAHRAVRRRLLEKQLPEYILKPYFTRELLEEPPAHSELQRLRIGLDYGYRDAFSLLLAGWQGDTLWVIRESCGRTRTIPEVVQEAKGWISEVGTVPVTFGPDRPELADQLGEAGIPCIPVHRRIEERLEALETIFREKRIRIAPSARVLLEQIPQYRRASVDGIFVQEPDGQSDDDAIDALGYLVLSYAKEDPSTGKPGTTYHAGERPGRGYYRCKGCLQRIALRDDDDELPTCTRGHSAWTRVKAAAPTADALEADLMPIRPSGKVLGPPITCDEILERVRPFKIRSDIVRLTGGIVNRGETQGDVEVYVERLTWEELLRIISFRIFRGLPEEIARRLHFLDDHTGGAFTPNIPLGDLWFVPKQNFVRIAMALEESLRSAPPEIVRQCERSKAEDRILPDRMFYLMKPWRGAYGGRRQTLAAFASLFKPDQFPRLVSSKRDGNTFAIFKQGDKVRIFSDDGHPCETMPNVEERIRKLPNESVVLLAEVDLWLDGFHYPREAVRAVAAGARADWLEGLIVNVFEVLYWNGRDIHRLDAFDRWNEFARKLDVDQSTDEVPTPGKLLNLIPQYSVKDSASLLELAKRLSDLPGSEGVVTKRGPWLLERSAPQDLSVKFRKAAWLVGVVTEKHKTKGGTYTYSYGIPCDGWRLPPAEPVQVEGVELAFVGRTFNTSLDLNPGDLIEVEFETLNYTEDLDKGQFYISAWVPELLRAVDRGDPSTVSQAIEGAKRQGVYRPKWIQDGETIYDPRRLKKPGKVTVVKASRADEELEVGDPYLVWPEHGRPQKVMRHLHARGRSVHADLRRQVHPDWAIGWTEAIQIEGAIKDDVDSIEDLKRIAADYSPEKGNRFLKPLIPKGRAGDSFGGRIFLEEKAPEPIEWLSYEGVVPPGSVGATAEYPGVFWIWDEGKCEWGAQKPYFHEYFDTGGKVFNGIYVCRLLKNVWGPELTGVAKQVWFGWYDSDPIPYVLTPRAVEAGWMPPDGQSALPHVVREHVPEKLRYWKAEGNRARRLRDELVRERIFSKETLGFDHAGNLIWKG